LKKPDKTRQRTVDPYASAFMTIVDPVMNLTFDLLTSEYDPRRYSHIRGACTQIVANSFTSSAG